MNRKPLISHWSYSSLMTFLRNPLAWYKRYVEKVYDVPSSPSSFVGRAGHKALEHFYRSTPTPALQAKAEALKEESIARGEEYLNDVQDIEINFGRATTKTAKKKKRERMRRDYHQAISAYLARPPRHRVLGVEVNAMAEVPGLILPVKAISDIVVRSHADKDTVDIVDHKFVNTFSALGAQRTLFILQAIFNYYTVQYTYDKPVRRFIVQECKLSKNADGSPQMRRYSINFDECEEEFALFHKLVNDATEEVARRKVFLPNPSDMFEGEDSFNIYRLGLVEEELG